MSCTIQDLSFSTGFFSRFMEKPGINHWVALENEYCDSTLEICYLLIRHTLKQTTPKYKHGYQHHYKDGLMLIREEMLIILAPHQVFHFLLQEEQLHGVRKTKPLSPSPLLKLNISHRRLQLNKDIELNQLNKN